MSTTKLYQNDVDLREWDSVISDLQPEEDEKSYRFYLEETAFFPEGGGQSCDNGIITFLSKGKPVDFRVFDVQEDGDDVVHMMRPADDADIAFVPAAGMAVHCALDWDRRFDNMQRHCGEHILSGIFYQECGGVNRGFHMGEDYMTIDISLEDEPTNPDRQKPEEITTELALHCQLLANRVVWSDAPVYVFRFDNREDAEKLPMRKALAFDEDISIVCVGSPENAADCVACCGTHPKTAGQVGLIKIYKVEKYKNMFRIYFEAGQRALADYDMKHAMLTEMSNSYSSSIEDFPSKIRSQEEKLAEVKGQLFHVKKLLIENECAELDALIEAGETGEDSHVLVYPLENLSMDDAFNMAKGYMGTPRTGGCLIMLYSVPDTSYILVSDGSIKCGSLVKEYAGFYSGKGGGNDVSARAIFTNDDDAGLFAELITKHLR